MGRQQQFAPEDYADEIEEWVSCGKTLRDYGRQEGKPSRRRIDEWRQADPAFAARIARAREIGFDVIAEEALAIADDGSSDTVTDEEGNERPNTEWINRSRLRVDTRLKLLAKWDPRRYGERLAVGGDGSGAPLRIEVVTGVSQPKP